MSVRSKDQPDGHHVGKKINLPLFADDVGKTKSSSSSSSSQSSPPARKPSIDAARSRLGGRPTAIELDGLLPGLAPGVLVTFALSSGRRLPGVIVFASSVEAHVLLDGIRLRRIAPSELTIHEPALAKENALPDVEVSLELTKIAGDARLFGQLTEGQSVRYADDAGVLTDGKVIEKCRWGALVLRDDGAVVAVGFRKLWPIPSQNDGRPSS